MCAEVRAGGAVDVEVFQKTDHLRSCGAQRELSMREACVYTVTFAESRTEWDTVVWIHFFVGVDGMNSAVSSRTSRMDLDRRYEGG